MRSGAGRVSLDERLRLDAALDEAFAPLRGRRSTAAAARVRAAVRWAPPERDGLRGISLLARVSGLTMAAAISAFLFTASVASVTTGLADASRDPARGAAWMLNGRTALQRPIDTRAMDYRTIAGDIAANAAIVRRRDAELEPSATPDRVPFPASH